MALDEKVIIKREVMEAIEIKLKGIKLQISDRDIKDQIDEVLYLVKNEFNTNKLSLDQIIKEKMDETKLSNPEIHFKLYMLYRKMVENKIGEEEALKAYETYVRE